jgi:hypothetical protein
MRDDVGLTIPACDTNPFAYLQQLLEILKVISGCLRRLSTAVVQESHPRTELPPVERMHPNRQRRNVVVGVPVVLENQSLTCGKRRRRM